MSVTYKVNDLMDIMEAIAPACMACESDAVGLHSGNPDDKVTKVLLALDAGFEVIDQAIKSRAQMIIAHHPRFFRPLQNVDESRREGKIAALLLRNKISLFCAHTNLDVTPGGVNDVLADLSGMAEKRRPLKTVYHDNILKLNVFVPEESLDAVRLAVCAAGAGEMGDYSECCYRVKGIGMFRPGSGAKPYIGNCGSLEEVEEWRLETVLPASCKCAVRKALLEAHPYEEPAYDFVTLHGSENYGLGRVGDLRKPLSLVTFAKKLKKSSGSTGCLMLGDKTSEIRRIAVWSGSSVPVSMVISSGVQALVCGELGHHDGELLQEKGIGAVVLGHWASEQPAMRVLGQNLQEALPDLEVIVSNNCCSPFYNI